MFICPLSLKEMNGTLPFVALRPCGCVFALAALKAIISSTPLTPPTTSSSGSDGDDATKPSSGKKSKAAEGASMPCPQCSMPFVPGYQTKDDPTAGSIMAINLPTEETEDARIALIGVREAQAAAKKAEKAASGKKRKSEVDGGSSKKSKKAAGEIVVESVVVVPLPKGKAPGGRLIPKSVADELAAAEERRKLGGMSAAVSSLYAPKDGKKEEKHGNDNWMTRGAFTRVSTRSCWPWKDGGVWCVGVCFRSLTIRSPDMSATTVRLIFSFCSLPLALPVEGQTFSWLLHARPFRHFVRLASHLTTQSDL